MGTVSAFGVARIWDAGLGQESVVVFDRKAGTVHTEASDWLRFLTSTQASPNTVMSYGAKVAGYLGWARAQGSRWDKSTLAQLAMWKNYLTLTPFATRGGVERRRSPQTVAIWMTALIEFFRWAATHNLVDTDLVSKFTVVRYQVPGSMGNERGFAREVRVKELGVRVAPLAKAPEWLDDARARERLMTLELEPRDRFLVDLLYSSGMRVGEALALFREDLHLLASSTALGCRVRGPHIHIKRNPTTNRARAKSLRVVPVSGSIALAYEDYRFARHEILGVDDNPHVFVSLRGPGAGAALTYASVLRLFRYLSEQIGERVRPHMLRHTRATLWLRGIDGSVVDLDVVARLLGHRTLASTLVYTHVTEGALRAAVERAAIQGAGVAAIEAVP